MGSHYLDLPFWALKLHAPTSVEAEGPPVHPEATPAWMIVRYEFPDSRGGRPIKLTWYDGDKHPEQVEQGKVPKWGSAVLFVGEKGKICVDRGRFKAEPESLAEGYKANTLPIKLYKSNNHIVDFIQCVRSRRDPIAPVEAGHQASYLGMIAEISIKLARTLRWDPQKETFLEDAEANGLLSAPMRSPWKLA